MKTVLFFSLEAGRMGGIAAVNRSLKKGLEEAGYQVKNLYLRAFSDGQPDPEGITVRETLPWKFTQGSEIKAALKEKKILRALKLVFARRGDSLRYRQDLKQAQKILRRERPDCIITSHYLLLDAVPREFLGRTLHHVHTSFSQTMAQKAGGEMLRRYRGKIGFLWLSRAICQKAKEAGFSDSFSLYNPLSHFPEERTLAEEKKDLVILTRFSEEKRLPLAVALCRKAFDQMPDPDEFRLLIYGQGPEEKAIQEAIGTDPRFLLMGKTDAPFDVLKNARLTVNTSSFEGFSISLLEAMASGVPILSFHFGEAAPEEVLDRVTGRLIPMDDNDAFVSALGELLKEDEEIKAMSLKAREYATRFRLEDTVTKLENVLSRLPLDKTEKEG